MLLLSKNIIWVQLTVFKNFLVRNITYRRKTKHFRTYLQRDYVLVLTPATILRNNGREFGNTPYRWKSLVNQSSPILSCLPLVTYKRRSAPFFVVGVTTKLRHQYGRSIFYVEKQCYQHTFVFVSVRGIWRDFLWLFCYGRVHNWWAMRQPFTQHSVHPYYVRM